MTRPKCYNWKPTQMSEHLNMGELLALRKSVEDDPESKNPAHTAGNSIYLYTPAARRRLDAISWAITYQLAAKKAATD